MQRQQRLTATTLCYTTHHTLHSTLHSTHSTHSTHTHTNCTLMCRQRLCPLRVHGHAHAVVGQRVREWERDRSAAALSSSWALAWPALLRRFVCKRVFPVAASRVFLFVFGQFSFSFLRRAARPFRCEMENRLALFGHVHNFYDLFSIFIIVIIYLQSRAGFLWRRQCSRKIRHSLYSQPKTRKILAKARLASFSLANANAVFHVCFRF